MATPRPTPNLLKMPPLTMPTLTPGLVITVETVTPDRARRWLADNHVNQRALSTAKVNRYAALMAAGDWTLTHQGLAFNPDGGLVDGQHRLAAVVKSGVTIEAVITRGDIRFDKIDIGKNRSLTDVFTIAGHPNAAATAAAIRSIHPYFTEDDRPWRSNHSASFIDNETFLTLADKHGTSVNLSYSAGRVIAKRIGGSATRYQAALYIARRWANSNGVAHQYEDWKTGLMTGAGFAEGDSRLALASYMNGAAKVLHNTHRHELQMLLTLRTLHMYLRDESSARFQIGKPGEYTFRLPGDNAVAVRNAWLP